MKLFICGATGRTGRELIKQSLERGHRPTAFVRSPEKLNIQDKNLIIIKGDVRNPIQLAQAASGTDAVLSALGTSGLLPTTLLADFTGAICQAMEKAPVKNVMSRRLVIISAALLSPGATAG
ncbi:MAG: NAD(P)H-binding protein [Nitrospiraceae bacterium]|nr:NAD(P)H-binding protein [Nitrospiraceae bacterium]MDA8089969.1 NAD(P)H-binding protein [Nitrospiraceae bacterium]